jgi:uncharacterized protein YkwD
MGRQRVVVVAMGIASWFVVGLAAVFTAAPDLRAAQEGSTKAPDVQLTPEIEELVAAHNKERAAAKLGPLTPNAKLMAAARVHARDMAEHEFMSHEGSDGSKFNERIERQGYFGLKLGENVAMGQRTVPGVMREWMKSPHHRENILGDFSEIGAARADSEEGVPYWCVDFGLPRPKLDRDEAITGVVEAVNRARAMADKPPLKVNPKLAKAAQ